MDVSARMAVHNVRACVYTHAYTHVDAHVPCARLHMPVHMPGDMFMHMPMHAALPNRLGRLLLEVQKRSAGSQSLKNRNNP